MRTIELGPEADGTSYALVLATGDEVLGALEAHARDNGIRAARFTALGAFQRAILAYFDWERKEYDELPVDEQVEVTALVGDIAVHEGEPVIHAHCVLGRRDGSAITGHLLSGVVRPTLELFLTTFPGALRRRMDPESGLPLIAGPGEEA